MCDSCKCGCKPGKPAKGCDCQCKDCRAAREGVSKSGRLVPVSEFSKKYDKYQAVNDAGMLPGAIGGSILGAYAARRRRPAVMLGTTLAGSLAGSVAGGAATTPIRRKMARKDRESAKVGKSLVELAEFSKASSYIKGLAEVARRSGSAAPGSLAEMRVNAYNWGRRGGVKDLSGMDERGAASAKGLRQARRNRKAGSPVTEGVPGAAELRRLPGYPAPSVRKP